MPLVIVVDDGYEAVPDIGDAVVQGVRDEEGEQWTDQQIRHTLGESLQPTDPRMQEGHAGDDEQDNAPICASPSSRPPSSSEIYEWFRRAGASYPQQQQQQKQQQRPISLLHRVIVGWGKQV